ncbi:MAG: hypothetical protein PQJ46_09170 [Spirochaetales bacterium]|nr:hypothetical protein [Spirochaetales bacterium]
MKYRKYKANFGNLTFIIEEDNPAVGFYLYVYENEKCIKDYLQNTLSIAKECAFEDYNVPMEIWQEVD